MSYVNIIDAIKARFVGVGLPEHTELLIPEKDGRAEYATRDHRFGMRMHTFVTAEETPPKKMRIQICSRLQYLKDKLLDDLRCGSKIFVFKLTTHNLEPSEIDELHAAMQLIGENTLFYVRLADENHANGTVCLVRKGLIIGYIDRFAMGPNGEDLGASTNSWITLCRKAHAVWRANKPLT